jgi:predicted transcriptional regulator YdeE
VIELGETSWAVFQPADRSDESLQALWPWVFTEWFAANGRQLAPGPEIVAMQRIEGSDELQRELWIPIEPAS